jgi:DNA-binding NarL/FixJ family response regulator
VYAFDDWQSVLPRLPHARLLQEELLAKSRLLLADDHTLVVEAFKKLLEPEFDVVATVSDGHALIRSAASLNPDVVLVDLNMPLLNGIEAGKKLKAAQPNIKIIVLTMDEDTATAIACLGQWASGYLLKRSAAAELSKAVREVVRGRKYIAPSLEKALAEAKLDGARTDSRRKLTPRQREVLQLLVEGHTMKEAAGILNVATRTVAFHKYRIMKEFGLESNTDLVRFAMREKIVS